ncbi:MAG: AsmA family protein, partial [Pseudomonadota bacterium]
MNTFLLTLGAIFVLVLTALFAVPHFVDWSTYRADIQEAVSKTLDRPVRVGSEITVRFLPAPYISVDNVRIADANGRFARPILRAQALTASLSVGQLIQGRLEASSVKLVQPLVTLSVDRDGRASWSGLGARGNTGPFEANEIALQSVEIERGEVLLVTSGDDELNRFENVTGTFSAGSLLGPYRFRGSVGRDARATDVRVTTAKLGTDGRLTLQATLRPAAGAPNWGTTVVDGDIITAGDAWKFEGGLTATVNPGLGRDGAGRAAASGADGSSSKTSGTGPIEIKSTLEADTQSLSLAALALTFEVNGRPQLIRGQALTDWREALTFDADFSARWLDLDGMSGVETPGVALSVLAQDLNNFVPQIEGAKVAFKLQQATALGGTIEDVALNAVRRSGAVVIEELTAQVPGEGQVQLAGRLSGARDTLPQFRGVVTGRGVNLARTLAWLSPETVG